MSADPLAGDVGDPQSLNLYTYVRNNAVNLIDPSGLCFESLGSERCGGFKFVITWSWGADHEDDGNPPLHPYPTRPPMRTSPAPHVAYGILPGETAGVPNWIGGPSDLSRWVIVNFGRASGGYVPQRGLYRSPVPIQILAIGFFLQSGANDNSAITVPRTQPPRRQQTFGQYLRCMGAQTTGNLLGDEDRAFWTTATAAAVILKYSGKRAAGLLLPGPGWFYVGAAIAWDGYQLFDAWKTCRK
jgi:hypothetical protein